jgi:hypothetical protein
MSVYPLAKYMTSAVPLRLPSGTTVSLAACSHDFKLWEGPPPPDAYGGKAVLDSNGEPVFAELAILRLIQEEGWQGVWIDTYRRKFRQFLPPHSCSLPPHAERFLDNANQGRKWRSGCSDLLAWNDLQYLFVEAKRRGKDLIRDTQRQWLESALNSGLPLDTFAIFEWSISSGAPRAS